MDSEDDVAGGESVRLSSKESTLPFRFGLDGSGGGIDEGEYPPPIKIMLAFPPSWRELLEPMGGQGRKTMALTTYNQTGVFDRSFDWS